MSDIKLGVGVEVDRSSFQQVNNELNNLVRSSNTPNLVSASFSPAVVNPYQNIQANNFANSNHPLFNNQFRERMGATSNSVKDLGEFSKKFIESIKTANESLLIFSKNLKENSNSENLGGGEDLTQSTDKSEEKKEKTENDKWNGLKSSQSIMSLIEKAVAIGSGISKGQLAYTQHAVTGDVIGANFARTDSRIGALQSAGGLVAGLGAILAPFTGGVSLALGSLIGGGMAIGGTALSMMTDRQKEKHAYAEQYKAALPQLTSLGTAFGGEGIRNNSAETNSRLDLARWTRLVSTYNKNTGMDNAAFTQLASNFAQYGVTSLDKAGAMANASARWQRFAGGNASEYADFMGKMSRYGSANAENDVGYAYSAAKNSGLSKGQFPEFLRGLQQVIENGISNGYVKSTKEVSDTLSMFGKMSGGHIAWTGQQGANKLIGMAQGLAGATALSTPSQIIAYQSLRNNSEEIKKAGEEGKWYINGLDNYNALAYMQDGVNVDKIKNVYSGLKKTYNNDTAQIIESLKKLFGLNELGAMQFLNFAEGGNFAAAQNTTENSKYLNNETKLQNALSTINESVVNLGKNTFGDELSKISDYTRKIYEEMKGEKASETYDTSNYDVNNLKFRPNEPVSKSEGLFGLRKRTVTGALNLNTLDVKDNPDKFLDVLANNGEFFGGVEALSDNSIKEILKGDNNFKKELNKALDKGDVKNVIDTEELTSLFKTMNTILSNIENNTKANNTKIVFKTN